MKSASTVSLRHLVAGACLAFAAAGAYAAVAETPPLPATETAALKQQFEQKFPGASIGSITRSPYFGLYEVQFDDTLVYTDSRLSYVFVGNVFDPATKKNLTEAKLRQINRIPVDNLPLELAFKRVKGNGARKLIVFSDADCPFCARLEKEFRTIDNVTIYTFLFPIDQLHPDSARKSRIIWCSADKVKSWDTFFSSGKLPDNKGDCANPLDATQALGNSLRITATPTMIFADGSMIPGAIPLAQIETELRNADAEVKKAAAAKN
jgi:thiol:disulfide interchange protein DsbC